MERTLFEPRTAAARPSHRSPLEPLPDPTISVVVGTWSDERWADVTRVVAAVRAQTHAAHELILVVDWNPNLLERARVELSGVHCVPNRYSRGLSGVRNTGVEEASGDVVAFVDDDAEPEPAWLQELAAGYATAGVLGVGGAIRPRWETRRPGWFPPEFDWVVGCTYTGLREDAGPVRNLIGANMSMRRAVVEELGGFRSDLSKIGSRSRPEDTDFCLRARSRWPAGTWLHRPSAVVHHRVPAERTTVSYFLTRCYNEGRGKAELVAEVGASGGLESERAYTRKTLPRAVARALGRGRLTRAAAVPIGLAAAGVGYGAGAAIEWRRSR
jgi:glucosyl-dolichyl phosphate glucuronosyltransferase